jgi:DNA polymerase III delta subunit
MVTIRGERGFQDCLARCLCGDLFTDNQGFIINNPAWLKETGAAITDGLGTLLASAVPIIIITPLLDKRSRIAKWFVKHKCPIKTCQAFKEWETDKLAQWVTDYAAFHHVALEPTALAHMIRLFGTHIAAIVNAINGVSVAILPRTTIRIADLDAMVGDAAGHYATLYQAILCGDAAAITQSAHALLTCREDPYKVINTVLFQLSQLLLFDAGVRNNKSAADIAKDCQKHPYYVGKQLDMIRKNPLRRQWPAWIACLAKGDRLVKQGAAAPEHTVIAWIAGIIY